MAITSSIIMLIKEGKIITIIWEKPIITTFQGGQIITIISEGPIITTFQGGQIITIISEGPIITTFREGTREMEVTRASTAMNLSLPWSRP